MIVLPLGFFFSRPRGLFLSDGFPLVLVDDDQDPPR